MYFKEVAQWVKKHNSEITLDIYSKNILDDVQKYLLELDCEEIQVKGAINYDQIPEILRSYHVGLIIYKGVTQNVKYCAPNKLFEYWACGLDIWFSTDLETSKNYKTSGVYPKVIEVDFMNLDDFDWKAAWDKEGLAYSPSPYFAEEVLNELYQAIIVE